jgi:hypothetical protein
MNVLGINTEYFWSYGICLFATGLMTGYALATYNFIKTLKNKTKELEEKFWDH